MSEQQQLTTWWRLSNRFELELRSVQVLKETARQVVVQGWNGTGPCTYFKTSSAFSFFRTREEALDAKLMILRHRCDALQKELKRAERGIAATQYELEGNHK